MSARRYVGRNARNAKLASRRKVSRGQETFRRGIFAKLRDPRMEKFVESKGRHIIGWDEILEGGLAPRMPR